MICAGVMSLAWEARLRTSAYSGVVRYALLNAVIIAGYTVVDGIGVRLSGASSGYLMWNLVLTAVILSIWTLLTRGGELFLMPRGVCALRLSVACDHASYGIVLWAMTQAPIAVVARLRETSMIFVLAMA